MTLETTETGSEISQQGRDDWDGWLGHSLKKKLAYWITLLRLGATARGILPFLLGAVIAWSHGYTIDWLILLLSSAAVICIMLMTFLVNEYCDYESDIANRDFHALSGGSRVLAAGLIPRRNAMIAAYIFAAMAIGVGLWLYLGLKTGPLTLPLGTLAIIIGYAYTASPFRLAYRGWGELSIWFACGWLATVMGYYLQTGEINIVVTLTSLPGAFSIFLVILINEIPDVKSDRIFGKKNLAVKLGIKKTVNLYLAVLAISYLSMFAVTLAGVPVSSIYLSFILLPLLVWIVYTVKKPGLKEKKVQESLSIRTMVYDHLIAVIYAVSFAIAGLNSGIADTGQLILLVAGFIVVFGLEGFGLLCSRATFPEPA